MIDQSAISTYFGNDESMLRRFVTIFVQESPSLINRMDEALANSNFADLAICAHTLKSQLRYFGYAELVECLQNIETDAEAEPNKARLQDMFGSFNRSFREAYGALSAIVS